MFRVFQEEKLITICMFAFLGSSILLRIFLGLLYRNMIKEADNMATTKNRLLKQCKTKFASCYQLGNGVANIPVFVDKFLNRMTLGHLSFETIYHLSGQLMLLSVVCSGVGVCKCIIQGRTVGEVLPFYIVSFFGLYMYFSISTVVDVRGKKRVLKINLVDYLENHLSPRIEVTRQDMEMLYGDSAFVEKRQPYGRIQRGRGGGRKSRKGIPAKPEKRRTVELMPIDKRMTADGEPFPEEASLGQQYIAAQQIQRNPEQRAAGEADGPWERRTTDAEKPGRINGDMMRGPEETAGMTGRPGRTADAAEGLERTADRMRGPEETAGMTGRPGRRADAAGGLEQTADKMGRPGRTADAAGESERTADRMTVPGQTAGTTGNENRGLRAEPAWQTSQADGQGESGSPEDSAAVTEEELEALLKEFLTT